jgi:hypothetical protein
MLGPAATFQDILTAALSLHIAIYLGYIFSLDTL